MLDVNAERWVRPNTDMLYDIVWLASYQLHLEESKFGVDRI